MPAIRPAEHDSDSSESSTRAAAAPYSRPARTIDQLADDGLVGAVIVGPPRSPDHAEHKLAARKQAFKDVVPASPGAFSFYNSAAPKRRGRVSTGFKVPSSVTPTKEPAKARTTPRISPNSRNTTTPTRIPPKTRIDTPSAIGKLVAALTASFDTPAADRVLAHWGRAESGDDRKTLIRRVAHELELDLARMAVQGEDYDTVLQETCNAVKLVRDERGVQLVLSGRIDRIDDPRAQRFRHVAACFRTAIDPL